MSERAEIDYRALTSRALRSVVSQVLQRVAEEGLPGAHFFYITIRTDHPDVEIPPSLREQYPEEITIVLQNQFWDLYADDELFSVELRFGGVPNRLVVPWDAVAAFVDPEAEFALRFEAEGSEELESTDEPESAAAPTTLEPRSESDAASEQGSSSDEASPTETGGATVVPFDAHRRR